MISNQILQETINGMKEVTGIDLCILDLSGRIVVTTMEITDALAQHAEEFADSMAESQVIDGFQYFKIFDDQRLEYILLATGMSENAYTVGKLAVMQIQNLLTAYKERLDKENFVKNLLRDNLLLVDIYNRSKKLHIEVEQRRVAFLIQAEYEKDQNLLEATKEVESGADSDFITAVDEKSIVYVTPVNGNEGQAQFIQHAKEIKEGLKSIGKKAFYACENLRKITIPASVTEIGEECLATGYYWVGSEEPVVDAKIYAPKGSYAIKYAKQNNIAYTETKAAASGNNSGNTSANITRKKVTVTALTSSKAGTIKLKWKKLSGADGYEIQYARNAKFTKNKKKVTVKKAAATSKTIKKLKKKSRKGARPKPLSISRLPQMRSTPRSTLPKQSRNSPNPLRLT